MTHLNIYTQFSLINDKLQVFYDKHCVGTKNSVFSLYWCMFGESRSTVIRYMEVLESEPEFCASCFYINLDSTRKAIHRYLLLEKEEQQQMDLSLLQEVVDTFNPICQSLKKEYKDDEECFTVKNTAYNTLNNLN